MRTYFFAISGLAIILWLAPTARSQSDTGLWVSFQNDLKEAAPLHYYLLKKEHDKVFELLPLVTDIDAIEPLTGTTPLTMAARDETSDAYDVVKAMVLVYGADLDEPEHTGFKALHYAVLAGNFPVVEFLVDHGADLNDSPLKDPGCAEDCEYSKKTPIYLAHWKNRLRIAEYLTSQGAVPLGSDEQGAIDIQDARRKLLDEFRYRYVRPPDKENPDVWYRKRLNEKIDELTKALDATGRIEEADSLRVHIEPLIQAILSIELEKGMAFRQWQDKVLDTFGNQESETARE